MRAADPDVVFSLAAGRAKATAAERAATVAVNTSPWLVDALPDRCRAVVRLGSSTEYAASPAPAGRGRRPRAARLLRRHQGRRLAAAAGGRRRARRAGGRAARLPGLRPRRPPDPAGAGRPGRRPHRRGRAAARPAQPAGLGVGRGRRRRLRPRGRGRRRCRPGAVLNIGTGVQTSTEELVATAARGDRPADRHRAPAPTPAATGTPPTGSATRPPPGRCSAGSRPSTWPRGWPAPGRRRDRPGRRRRARVRQRGDPAAAGRAAGRRAGRPGLAAAAGRRRLARRQRRRGRGARRRATRGSRSPRWPVNVGQHRALARGLADEPDADAWVCLDADLQDPPEAVPLLLDRLARGDVAAVFAGRRGAYESPVRRLTGGAAPPGGRAADRPAARRRRLPRDGPGGARPPSSPRWPRAAPSVVLAVGRARRPVTSVPVARDRRPVGPVGLDRPGAAAAVGAVAGLGRAPPLIARSALPELEHQVGLARRGSRARRSCAGRPSRRIVVVVRGLGLAVEQPADQPHPVGVGGCVVRRQDEVGAQLGRRGSRT